MDDLIAARDELPDDYDPLLAELVVIGQGLATTWQAVTHGTRAIRGADRVLMESWLEDSSRMLDLAALSPERQAAIDGLVLSGENRGELIDRLIGPQAVKKTKAATSSDPIEAREERLEAACADAVGRATQLAAPGGSLAFCGSVTTTLGGGDWPGMFAACAIVSIDAITAVLPKLLPAEQLPGGVARAEQRHPALIPAIEAVLADGFVAGLVVTSTRGEMAGIDPAPSIYPTEAIRWYCGRAGPDLMDEFDKDPLAPEILMSLSDEDCRACLQIAAGVQEASGSGSSPELWAVAYEIAIRGFVLFRVHTEAVQQRYKSDHLAWVTRRIAGLGSPFPPDS